MTPPTGRRAGIIPPAWTRRVCVGDVLKSATGSFRVVRAVGYKPNGALRSVVFTIQHCSWTHRCLTTLTYTDLIQRGFRPTRARVTMRTPLDREIMRHVRDSRVRRLRCCDVRGVA